MPTKYNFHEMDEFEKELPIIGHRSNIMPVDQYIQSLCIRIQQI